ncbi:DICT sensory domain-containing protein [Actinomycetospora sp.]|jgi:GGDEF domain-containing protein|uniref:DICT sensory domain-containing protein n=1 Tax=Actinomycetospora sp. TaxID=1872135 RepID=UPI002F4090AF
MAETDTTAAARYRASGEEPTRTPDMPGPASKRSLVAISHAIESAVLQGPCEEPTVVVALFQRLAYFTRERAVYERLARSGVRVVVGFSDGESHEVGEDVECVTLDPREPLADEWTVIAVGPDAGAFLVATDTGEIDPTEYTLEAGRWFMGRWGYSKVQAANELARMRIALGDRLRADTTRAIDGLLARIMPPGGAAAASRGTAGEQWATASLQRMTARMHHARAGSRRLRAQLADAQAAAEARAEAKVEQQSGLPSPEFLGRWAGTDGRASALPIGLAVFDIVGLEDAENRHSRRTAYHAARQTAAALTEPLGPVDAAVRMSTREFALIVPGASAAHLTRVAAAAAEQLELFSQGYPHVDLSARVATTVTVARPLPLDDLHLALGHPAHSDQAPTTLFGDEITLADTGALARIAAEAGEEPSDEASTSRWFRSRDGARLDTVRLPRLRVDAAPRTDGSAEPAPGAPSWAATPTPPEGAPEESAAPAGEATPSTDDAPEESADRGDLSPPVFDLRGLPAPTEDRISGSLPQRSPRPDPADDGRRNGHAHSDGTAAS